MSAARRRPLATRSRLHRHRVLTQPHISDGERPAAFHAPWDKSRPHRAITRQHKARAAIPPVPIMAEDTATMADIAAIVHRPTADRTEAVAIARRLMADRQAATATQHRRPIAQVPTAAEVITSAQA